MNAQEARQLATSSITEEHHLAAQAAAMRIERAARSGDRQVMLSTRHIGWLTRYLRDQGYIVTDTSSQHDGPSLEVAW